jgi:hypothetical protein
MSWEWVTQSVQVALSLLLIARLFPLRRYRIYRIFSAFLLADVAGSLFWFTWTDSYKVRTYVDYRAGWLAGKVAVWVLTVWTIYALLAAISANLQGIYRFSRRVLNISFAVTITIGLLSAVPEYLASGLARPDFGVDVLDKLAVMAVIFDRVLSSVALLVVLCILCLLLWFPVEISRNLAVFTSGFVIYFAAKTALLLGRSFWSHDSTRIVSIAITAVLSVCLAYWAVFISPAGEHVRTRLGHRWQPREQERLIGQLEAMNAALLRASQRKMPPQGVSR